MAVQPTDLLLKQIMTNENLHAAGAFNGVFDLMDLRLFVNNPVLSKTSVLADLTAPTFAGYADKANIVLGALHQRPDKGWAYDTPLESFQMADNLLPTVIMGYGCFPHGTTDLWFAEYLPAPVALVTTADMLNLVAQFCLGGLDWGQCTVIP